MMLTRLAERRAAEGPAVHQAGVVAEDSCTDAHDARPLGGFSN